MDFESIGGGALTGFVSSILTLLGWNRRMNKLEDFKQSTEVCNQKHAQFMAVQEQTNEDIRYIKVRLDKLYDMMLNGSIRREKP